MPLAKKSKEICRSYYVHLRPSTHGPAYTRIMYAREHSFTHIHCRVNRKSCTSSEIVLVYMFRVCVCDMITFSNTYTLTYIVTSNDFFSFSFRSPDKSSDFKVCLYCVLFVLYRY